MRLSFLHCSHRRLSFPMVTRESAGHPGTGGNGHGRPHVTCLDCGREFWYDWKTMRRERQRPRPVYFTRHAA